ncbi:heavy metal sensor histidine kinase [Pseudomonas sp. DTU_2021_1001937_2_SI_NGA_ILE_001]|uniref:heavy metal sensor histidine kinase n=1 Tax=Pseudomonas sp. DTU_2021_1001937_2_SI_NGA_ILE_001 TaxID=3077589 RepID=UPI0028FC0DC8|nr:heavy metal sensor histidine kinase [Pseudomonas sp. DTU_2021_1001937_2_SI_NGA_ILE_001]WNW13614.1 heavy metal sensor histidine kinase [Pseudomonas sp. DTU_2021_1001937_2_SI_NGA_ILE_001]
MRADSIALRLAGLFALVAFGVFLLIGWALYLQVDKHLDLLPEAEVDARYSVLESTIKRFGDAEHWSKLKNKLNLLSEEDKRIRFWVVSPDPTYEYGHPDAEIRRFAQGAPGMRDLTLPGQPFPYKVLVSEFAARDQRPALRFLTAIDTRPFRQTQHALLVALVGLAALGVLLASLLGYWVARIGLRPLTSLSQEADKLSPPNLSQRLQLSPLPPELARFVQAFNATLARVEQAYSRLQSFNADVAHELRSPLTNLIGQTQVVLTRGRSAEDYFEVLQSNLEELERLRSIVNDMLFLASADQGSKARELTCTPLADEVATTLDYLDFILEDAQVSVEVQGDASAPVEKALLRRALINLLHNAVQHTSPGQTIRVEIDTVDAQVHVSVSNPGPAIGETHLPMLFERFYRVDASRSNSGANHGLGLAIVKAIALMHGGSVFASSNAGVNRFGISLPSR